MDLTDLDCQGQFGPLQFWLGTAESDACLSLAVTALQGAVVLAAAITARHWILRQSRLAQQPCPVTRGGDRDAASAPAAWPPSHRKHPGA
ncbi:hypothetical protein [Dinoroseobacter sp. S124A]|uniref:hypothetical protein n=1 Tax=Dinoroseobacter sp. S124A TaxID=3415128 RepID=UPI003C7C9617